MELVNHVLSFRPTHPAASIIRNVHREQICETTITSKDDEREIEEATFMELWLFFGDTFGVFKNTLFEVYLEIEYKEDMLKYGRDIVTDYDKIYQLYKSDYESPWRILDAYESILVRLNK